MPRQLRSFAIGLEYHLTVRGNNKRIIFHSDDERIFYMNLLQRFSYENHIDFHAYALMDNHVHLHCSMRSEKSDISMFMKNVHHIYACVINTATGGSGKLFERRFSSKLIENERQSLNNKIYIESNPLRAGLQRDTIYKTWNSFSPKRIIETTRCSGQRLLCDCIETVCKHYLNAFDARVKYLISEESQKALKIQYKKGLTSRAAYIPRRPDGTDAR